MCRRIDDSLHPPFWKGEEFMSLLEVSGAESEYKEPEEYTSLVNRITELECAQKHLLDRLHSQLVIQLYSRGTLLREFSMHDNHSGSGCAFQSPISLDVTEVRVFRR